MNFKLLTACPRHFGLDEALVFAMTDRHLVRSVYRELLRLSQRGRRPEIFAMPESWSTPSLNDLTTLPSSRADAVALLKAGFTDPALAVDPFVALRRASSAARALIPEPRSLPRTLPAFVLPSHLLFPHERSEFVLFEPRYRRLADLALGLTRSSRSAAQQQEEGKGDVANGWYAHIDNEETGVGVLASIMQHQQLDDGRVVIEVLGGPRCKVTAIDRLEEMASSSSSELPLTHVQFELVRECYAARPAQEAEDNSLAFSLLTRMFTLFKKGQSGAKATLDRIPPLNAEELAFMIGYLVIHSNDPKRRKEWLGDVLSVNDRLQFLDAKISVMEDDDERAEEE